MTRRKAGRPALRIVFEDADVIVVDKPAGLLTIATAKESVRTAYHELTDYVRRSDPRARVFIVHRLDRDTSGLLVFARTAAAKNSLQQSWNESVRERGYVAVVEGDFHGPERTFRSYLKENKAYRVYSTRSPTEGKLAITHVSVITGNGRYTMLRVVLETGRKNQIRVHLSEAGHCVAGDARYGATGNPIRRLALHAATLEFIHPRTGAVLRFESPAPAAFHSLAARK